MDFSRGQLGYEYHPTTGQVSAINAPEGVRLDYSYDGPLATGTTWSGPVNGSESFTYDADFRMATRSVNSANTVAYSYDNDGLLTLVGALSIARDAASRRITGTTLGNVTDAFTYNGFGEVATYSAAFLGATLFAQTFVRDRLGRITTKTETVEGVTTVYGYTYDLAGRLTEVRENGVLVRSYTYDANGNRLSKTTLTETITADYDGQDRLLRYGDVVYTWTNNGEMASKTDTVRGETTVFTYDEIGNMVAVVLPDGREITYVIDGQNRRIGKRVGGAVSRIWLYQSRLRVAVEYGASSETTFVFSRSSNSPEYLVRDGVTYRQLHDELGSPRLVIDVSTGAVVQRVSRDEFGMTVGSAGIVFSPVGFAGGLTDSDTGLVRFGARDYDPALGRWTAKEPLGFAGGDSGFYSYARNDPINHRDPTGRYVVLVPILYFMALALEDANIVLGAGAAAATATAVYHSLLELIAEASQAEEDEAEAEQEVTDDQILSDQPPPTTCGEQAEPNQPMRKMPPNTSKQALCVAAAQVAGNLCRAALVFPPGFCASLQPTLLLACA